MVVKWPRAAGRVELNHTPEKHRMIDYLNALPADLREVIEAMYVDGLSEREAAGRLNITRHQLRTRHKRAIAILRREV
jgi:RNA polymerase sigma factor (sigma-70 family)